LSHDSTADPANFIHHGSSDFSLNSPQQLPDSH